MNVDTATLVCRLTTFLADPETQRVAQQKDQTRKQVALQRLYHELRMGRKAGLFGYRAGADALRTVEGWMTKADQQAAAQ